MTAEEHKKLVATVSKVIDLTRQNKKQIADHLGVSRSTINYWLANDRGPADYDGVISKLTDMIINSDDYKQYQSFETRSEVKDSE